MRKEQREENHIFQWHPAFYAGLQIELEEESEYLMFENEHRLGTKPRAIDVLVIKKTNERISSNIGEIFRRYNIIEYKSPSDYMGIDDFYKVYAYACLYKADQKEEDAVSIDEITITIACSRYPRKLIHHLESSRGYFVRKKEKGIYYVMGAKIPIQLVLLHQLSGEKNLWLHSLSVEMSGREEAESLLKEYEKHKRDKKYRSVMDMIVRVNREQFLEVKKMCQALEELMADELEDMRKKGQEDGRKEGIARFAKLSGILLRQNRQDLLLKATEDGDYMEQLFQKYKI